MILKKCLFCKNKFYARTSEIKKGFAKFCGRQCHHAAFRQGKKFQCEICKKDIFRANNKIRRSKSGKFFCSKSCQTIWRNKKYSGKLHKNWKHGHNTYRRRLLNDGRKQICGICKTTDIRVLSVHHIDGNHTNNIVDNLEWLCFNCHYLVHHDSDEMAKFLLSIKV